MEVNSGEKIDIYMSQIDQVIQQQIKNTEAVLYVYQESLIHMKMGHIHIVLLEMPF